MTAATIGRIARPIFSTKNRNVRRIVSQVTLAAFDALAFTTSDFIFRAHVNVPALAFFPGRSPGQHPLQVDVFSILTILFIAVRLVSGDYTRRELFWDNARTTTRAILITSIPDILLMLVGLGVYSVSGILLSWAFLLCALPLYRQLARILLLKAGVWAIPSALIGEGGPLARINAALSSSLSLGFEMRAVFDLGERRSSAAAASGAVSRNPVEVVHLARQTGCELVVLAAEDMQSDLTSDLTRAVLEDGMSLAIVPSLHRLPLSGLSVNQFFGKDVLLFQVRDRSRELPRRILKRGFDLVGSLALIFVLSPLFAAIAIAIKRYDKGPIFYGHTRVGRGGAAFPCLKFRTMAVDADQRLALWKQEHPELYAEFLKTFKLRNDPRVTGPGKWLRRTSLDELPQLFNVLRGEMSLVGPRPVLQSELDQYYGNAAHLYMRVRPGMSGLWQVSGRSDTTYEERVTYDELYVLNWSFWYDLVILIQTAWFVVRGRGAF